jgi:hypothetical protein
MSNEYTTPHGLPIGWTDEDAEQAAGRAAQLYEQQGLTDYARCWDEAVAEWWAKRRPPRSESYVEFCERVGMPERYNERAFKAALRTVFGW